MFQLALGNFQPRSPAAVDTRNAHRVPLLLMSGKRDHTVPDVLTRSTFKRYRRSDAVTEYKQYGDRGHSLIVDSGSPQLMTEALAWLREREPALTRGSPS